MNKLYPIFVALTDQPVLVVGGGAVALRKSRGLLDSGARITAVSLVWHDDFSALSQITRLTQPYDSSLMRQRPWRLVFAATNNTSVNQQVADDAHALNILCCRCDDGSAGDFVGAASRGDAVVQIALSSHGASPALAARMADQAWQGVDPLLLEWAALLEQWRPIVVAKLTDHARSLLLKRIASAEMEKILRSSGASAAQDAFNNWLRNSLSPHP